MTSKDRFRLIGVTVITGLTVSHCFFKCNGLIVPYLDLFYTSVFFFRPKNFYGPSDNIQKMSGQTFNYGYLVHTRNFWRWLFKWNLINAYKREWAQNATYNIIVFFMVWLQLNWHENRDIVSLKFVITTCWKFKIKVKNNGIFIILH